MMMVGPLQSHGPLFLLVFQTLSVLLANPLAVTEMEQLNLPCTSHLPADHHAKHDFLISGHERQGCRQTAYFCCSGRSKDCTQQDSQQASSWYSIISTVPLQ